MFDNYKYMDSGNRDIPLSFDYLSLEFIKNNLDNIDNISDRDLYELIRKSYGILLEDIFVSKNVDLIRAMYSNPKFIMQLTNVVSDPNIVMTETQRIWCNKLAYDYLNSSANHDEYVKTMLLKLSSTVNRQYTPALIGMGLNETFVSYLVNARFSTERDLIQVKRMNLVIMNQHPEFMSVQTIVDIYGVLFKRITPLFTGIIYDAWTEEQLVDQNVAEIYATITTAIIEIINSLPQDMMYQLLENFTQSHTMLNSNNEIRFNIYATCAEDYPRLHYVLELLKNNGIIVPS